MLPISEVAARGKGRYTSTRCYWCSFPMDFCGSMVCPTSQRDPSQIDGSGRSLHLADMLVSGLEISHPSRGAHAQHTLTTSSIAITHDDKRGENPLLRSCVVRATSLSNIMSAQAVETCIRLSTTLATELCGLVSANVPGQVVISRK